MTIIDLARPLAETFEGCRLKAYRDPVGIWTIGYGHTGPEVTEGLTIDQATAERWLERDLAKAEAWTYTLCPVALAVHQRAALTDFVFNLGPGRLRASTLRRKVNAGNDAGAAQEFGRWIYAGGRILSGLVLRRAAERALFLS